MTDIVIVINQSQRTFRPVRQSWFFFSWSVLRELKSTLRDDESFDDFLLWIPCATCRTLDASCDPPPSPSSLCFVDLPVSPSAVSSGFKRKKVRSSHVRAERAHENVCETVIKRTHLARRSPRLFPYRTSGHRERAETVARARMRTTPPLRSRATRARCDAEPRL